MDTNAGELTVLLERVASGDSGAEHDLARLVYDELRDVAAVKLRDQRPEFTLTPTMLVHEAYLRVLGQNGTSIQNRRHLFFAFAQAMWRIVVDRHRRKRLPIIGVQLEELPADTTTDLAIILDLDQALARLKQNYPREYEVAILRKSLGFSIDETAELLGVSTTTVKRDWEFVRAFVTRHLGDDGSQSDGSA